MSIEQIFGFDVFPGAANGALPVAYAGIANTPYAAAFNSVSQGGATVLGVSGLDKHAFGSGSTRRNGLVTYRQRSTTSNWGCYFHLIYGWIPGNGTWSKTVQFSFKNVSAVDNNYSTNIVGLGNAPGARNANMLGMHTNNELIFMGSVHPTIKLQRNREYHFEIRMSRKSTDAVNSVKFDLRIDGEEVWSITQAPIQTTTAYYIFAGSLLNANNNYDQDFIWADIVIGGGDYLGPQRVLPLKVTSVPAAGGWEKEGNATPADTLNDTSDATYYTSPADNGALQVKVGVDVPAVSPMNAMQLYIRSARDQSAGRALRARLTDASDVDLAPVANVTNAVAYSDFKAVDLKENATLATVGDFTKATLKISAVVP
jgi:hypothetical protein